MLCYVIVRSRRISHFILLKITVKADIGKYNEQDRKAEHLQLPLEKRKYDIIRHFSK